MCCSNYLLSVLWVPSILPPGILNFGKVFNTAGFVSEFQVFAASGVSCKLCVPEGMNAFHPRWYKTCSEKTWVWPPRVTTREERCFDIFVLVTSINFVTDV